MVDIRPNPLLPNVTKEGKGKWHCSFPFLNLQNSVGGSPPSWGRFSQKVEFIVFRLSWVVRLSCEPLSFFLMAIYPAPSFIFNFSFFIAGEPSLLSGPLEQGPAMNERIAVWEKWTFGIFIIPVVHGYVSYSLILHYTTAIFIVFSPSRWGDFILVLK